LGRSNAITFASAASMRDLLVCGEPAAPDPCTPSNAEINAAYPVSRNARVCMQSNPQDK
jgi:hypothetical protein